METAVIMKRPILGGEIAQNSKTEFFSATDLVRVGNKWREKNGLSKFNLSRWIKQKGNQEFIAELEEEFGQVRFVSRGKEVVTWVHPLLFVGIALSISPKFKVESLKWLYDCLIQNRNQSGDTYKRMCGALFVRFKNKRFFSEYISSVARIIKKECRVRDWQHATEEQLERRNKYHENIAMLAGVLGDSNQAVRLGIIETNKYYGGSLVKAKKKKKKKKKRD